MQVFGQQPHVLRDIFSLVQAPDKDAVQQDGKRRGPGQPGGAGAAGRDGVEGMLLPMDDETAVPLPGAGRSATVGLRPSASPKAGMPPLLWCNSA